MTRLILLLLVSGTLAFPIVPVSVSCSPATITAPGAVTCSVRVNQTGGGTVNLASSSGNVTVPATVSVGSSATSASFAATVTSVIASESVVITASVGTSSKSFALLLIPPSSASSNSAASTVLSLTYDFVNDTGSTDAYVGCTNPVLLSYQNGTRILFKPNTTNTGAASLNVCGLGAKAIKKADGTSDPADGALTAGQTYWLRYDGTVFRIFGGGNSASAISDVTGLQAALDAKAALSHSHIIADTTNLQTELDAKLDAGDSTLGPGAFDLYEQASNGSNKLTVSAPAAISSDWTLTLPASAPSGVLKASSGTVSTVSGSATDCVKVDGSSGACGGGGSAKAFLIAAPDHSTTLVCDNTERTAFTHTITANTIAVGDTVSFKIFISVPNVSFENVSVRPDWGGVQIFQVTTAADLQGIYRFELIPLTATTYTVFGAVTKSSGAYAVLNQENTLSADITGSITYALKYHCPLVAGDPITMTQVVEVIKP